MSINYVTKEGLEKMKQELDYLIKVERKKVTEQIAEAREKGDLSENAEYDAAKEAQAMLEQRIAQLQEKILNSRVIDSSNVDTDTVGMMNKVVLKNIKTKQTITYTIVPDSETNVKEGKISIKTPIAAALLGKKVKDKVKVNIPSGTIELEILEITI